MLKFLFCYFTKEVLLKKLNLKLFKKNTNKDLETLMNKNLSKCEPKILFIKIIYFYVVSASKYDTL